MRFPVVLLLLVGCGSSADNPADDDDGDTDGSTGDGGAPMCEPPGRFGAPTSTFTLPANGTGFNYADVQSAFPDVDWATLDRLYLPAGRYTNIQLGNLPVRSADDPLVITNHGGQFWIGGNPNGNYLWSMGGGANWVLTGRYDAESQTGDAAFPGHGCGEYAGSPGTYGIVSDDEYAFDAPYLHMGLAVGGGATDFEIEYVEIARSGFAGIRLLNAPSEGTDKPMANVRVHDTYVHDVAGEGYYFGWTGGAPSNKFPGLQIYNNRILRSGNEALQIQDVGDGSRVHHNTFISGGLEWLDNGLGRYQDNLAQISTREGTIEIDHNVWIDGAGSLVSFWSAPQPGDGDRHVTFHDNYFSDVLSLPVYLGGTSTAPSTFTWRDNVFRNIEFGYTPIDPAAMPPAGVASAGTDFDAAVTFSGNTWTGPMRLVPGVETGDGTSGAITLTGNTRADAPAIALRSGPWSSAGHHLTSWVATATVPDPDHAASYRTGDVVTHGPAPTLYRCLRDATGEPPDATPDAWEPLAAPTDDVRVEPGTEYADYGIR